MSARMVLFVLPTKSCLMVWILRILAPTPGPSNWPLSASRMSRFVPVPPSIASRLLKVVAPSLAARNSKISSPPLPWLVMTLSVAGKLK